MRLKTKSLTFKISPICFPKCCISKQPLGVFLHLCIGCLQKSNELSIDLEKIIKQCKKNDRAAQSALYRMFSAKFYGVCLFYSKDSTEAQDILQDGFIKVFENIKQFENKGSFEGWMRKIFVNTALERFRRKKLLFTLDDPAGNDYDDHDFSEFESQIHAQDLLTIIKDISPQYRMVFNLYCIEGYTHAEIGKMLNISTGTSKSNLARARKVLQEKVSEKYGIVELEKTNVS